MHDVRGCLTFEQCRVPQEKSRRPCRTQAPLTWPHEDVTKARWVLRDKGSFVTPISIRRSRGNVSGPTMKSAHPLSHNNVANRWHAVIESWRSRDCSILATSDRQQLEWIIHDGFTQTNKAVGFLEAKDVSRLLNILGMCKFHAANIWRLTSDNARCTRLFNIWTMPCTAREVQTPVQDTSTFDMATRGCDKSTVGIKRQGLFCHTAQYQALAGQCERTYHEVSTSSEPQQCCQ